MSEAEEVPILGRADEAHSFKQLAALYGAPAFVRRARAVEEGWSELLDRCSRRREEWQTMPRLRIGLLGAFLARDWDRLRPLLADEAQVAGLRKLHADLSPRLRSPVAPSRSLCPLRLALLDLCESLKLFNHRWMHYAERLDLGPVNALREGYNRWYILEKECAVRSPRLAREGFVRLAPLTTADVLRALPLLPVPVLSGV